MKMSDMNKTQKQAFMQVVNASNWVVGGYENSVMDGIIEEMPSREELFNEIYYTVMHFTTVEGCQTMRPIKEVRFAGESFIKERIDRRLTKMGFPK